MVEKLLLLFYELMVTKLKLYMKKYSGYYIVENNGKQRSLKIAKSSYFGGKN